MAALLSGLTRSNIVAGLLGTVVGNPWTFPFIWIWTYELGRRMGAGNNLTGDPNFIAIFTDLPGVVVKALISFDLDSAYFDNVWAVLWPMMVGSIPTFFLVWLVFYLVLKPLVAAYQAKRIARRRRKQQKLRTPAILEPVNDYLPEECDTDEEEPSVNDPVVKEANG